jgi:hypothetical protein
MPSFGSTYCSLHRALTRLKAEFYCWVPISSLRDWFLSEWRREEESWHLMPPRVPPLSRPLCVAKRRLPWSRSTAECLCLPLSGSISPAPTSLEPTQREGIDSDEGYNLSPHFHPEAIALLYIGLCMQSTKRGSLYRDIQGYNVCLFIVCAMVQAIEGVWGTYTSRAHYRPTYLYQW